jgi:alkanesulfonate monooxygenase SsuD/methylene tetrahydromethanopterin reductase-like flavin-dependent oxidoreductase (luciferase family)
MRLLWADKPEGATHSGEFFEVRNVTCYPKPAQGERLPIHIGGHSVASARRAGRFGAGFQPLGLTGPRLRELVDVMRDEATRASRDPEAIELSLGHLVAKVDPERAGKLAELGASRVVLAMSPVSGIEQVKDELSACAQRLGLAT